MADDHVAPTHERNHDNRSSFPRDRAQDDDGPPIIHSENSQGAVPERPPHPPPSCTHLRPAPSSENDAASSASVAPSAGLAHERQTLLLMLLGQVCSLHDATPRTFVVHVIALYERGILDYNSIRFLFELGLVPRGYDLNQIEGGETNEGGEQDEGERVDRSSKHCENATKTESGSEVRRNDAVRTEGDDGAIVPYCAEAPHHPWNRYLPPPSSSTSSAESDYPKLSKQQKEFQRENDSEPTERKNRATIQPRH